MNLLLSHVDSLMTNWELLRTQNSGFGCWDDVIQGIGRNLSSPRSSTACVAQGLRNTATSFYFRKQASIILLILQLDCWCFWQSRGQILCNVSCGQNGKMTKHFYTFQFLDCSRGCCGFSNWRHHLLLLTAVSSIPWYSLLLLVPLLRPNCFF